MSRSHPERIKVKELTTGVHLVCIMDASVIKRDNLPLITEKGETGILVTFTTGDNKSFEQDFWIGSDREAFFNKMCICAGIDRNLPFRKEATGKRLWIAIKEVYDIDGEEMVKDATGEPIINYYIFDYIHLGNVEQKPSLKGDPATHPKKQASGAFMDYRQVDKPCETKQAIIDGGLKMKPLKPKEVVIAEQKEMIKNVELKKSYPLKETDVFAQPERSKEVDPFALPAPQKITTTVVEAGTGYIENKTVDPTDPTQPVNWDLI